MSSIKAAFFTGASSVASLPTKTVLPEVAFIGRSNVGKSSLINTLVNRTSLAHVSSTPGKTQQINFYTIEDTWMLVDMPGFGYASVSKTDRKAWHELNYEYLLHREQLRLVCVLIDARHDPSPIDMELLERLENAERKYVVILTKSDKLSSIQATERQTQLQDALSMCSFCVDVLPYSSRTRFGREQLWGVIKRETKENSTINTQ